MFTSIMSEVRVDCSTNLCQSWLKLATITYSIYPALLYINVCDVYIPK